MSDRGIPAGWRHMHGYYGHTLKLVQSNGEWVYAQFHLISDQGTANFTAEEAAERWVFAYSSQSELLSSDRQIGVRKTCTKRLSGVIVRPGR
jgi:catalase